MCELRGQAAERDQGLDVDLAVDVALELDVDGRVARLGGVSGSDCA